MARHGETFVRSRSAPLLIAGAAARGVDVAAVLRRLCLAVPEGSPNVIELPLDMLRTLGDSLAEAARDDALGMRIGATLPRGAYGLLEFCVRTCGSLRGGIHEFARCSALVNEIAVVRVDESVAGLLLAESVPGEPLGAGRQVNELTLALYVRLIREVVGASEWSPGKVLFTHAAPKDPSPLVDYFGTHRIAFGQRENGLLVSASVLDRPLIGADPALFEVLQAQIEKELGQRTPVVDFDSALRRRIGEHLSHGNPELDKVASELRTSVRSLQRRLQARGTSFHRVVDEVRRELAFAYLMEPERALGEVAASLGYADFRAFARAFHRWSGESPGAWRRRHASR